MKKGFTLTEVLIALSVIAIITAILMPIIFKMRPNQEVLMVKKAYNMTQAIVSEMINDEKCYPFRYDRVGFENETAYTNCSYNASADATTKFREVFKSYVNPIEDSSGNTFTTKDGMKWTLSGRFIANGGGNSQTIITVDTNPGKEKSNDTFVMVIGADGKIWIDEDYEWAREAVGIDKKLVGND